MDGGGRWQTARVPSELTEPASAALRWFVAADDAPATAVASGPDALALVEVVQRERPTAVVALHVADRERTGAARARHLRAIGRPGQTLVSAAAAAALSGAGELRDLGVHRLGDLLPPAAARAWSTALCSPSVTKWMVLSAGQSAGGSCVRMYTGTPIGWRPPQPSARSK